MRKHVWWFCALCAAVVPGVMYMVRSRGETTQERAAAPSEQLSEERSASPSERPSRPMPSARSLSLSSPQPEPQTSALRSAESPLPDAPRLRKPLVDAIRKPKLNAEQKRRAMLHAIEASGSSDEPWTEDAEETFEEWRRGMPSNVVGTLTVGSPRCFQAGCVVDVSMPNEAAYDDAARAFRMLQEHAAQHGGRVQTPAVTSGQGFSASWIFLRPEGADHDGA